MTLKWKHDKKTDGKIKNDNKKTYCVVNWLECFEMRFEMRFHLRSFEKEERDLLK